MLVDTHSHFYVEEFDEDRHEAIARARAAGVEKLLMPNIDAATLPRLLALCDDYPRVCFPMIGLHPEEVRDDWRERLAAMKQQLDADRAADGAHRFVGIGEVGLDFYWDTTYQQEQLETLERQVAWASETRLPLVIHMRAAFDALYNLFSSHRADGLTGIFHCFSGTAEEAKALLSFDGFMLGIGGVVTYKKSTLPDVLKEVPLDRIVVETDCPYLSPVPHRGQRNESAYIVDTVHKIADIYGCSADEVAQRTTANATRLFPVLKD